MVMSGFAKIDLLTGELPMDSIECVVVGAGVVGLAIARAFALSGHEVLLLEAENAIGTQTSSRNSEVIHSGIYYPTGSLKARFCVQGRRLLYDYCQSHNVPFHRCGKLVVATSELQIESLHAIKTRALANGVADIMEISPKDVMQMEPELECVAALYSPSTGILDSHALMLAYLGDAETAGVMLALNSALEKGEITKQGFKLKVGKTTVASKILVNSAGFRAPTVARMINGFPAARIPPELYAKGNYFSFSGKPPFSRLIYPIPEPGGLGVHVTVDLAGQVRFGPDVEWVDRVDYSVDPRRADQFYSAIRRYWPRLPDKSLTPAYSGIRPKISGPDEPGVDFIIQGPKDHGIPGLINLFGIESPGLTSSLAIAAEVTALLSS